MSLLSLSLAQPPLELEDAILLSTLLVPLMLSSLLLLLDTCRMSSTTEIQQFTYDTFLYLILTKQTVSSALIRRSSSNVFSEVVHFHFYFLFVEVVGVGPAADSLYNDLLRQN